MNKGGLVVSKKEMTKLWIENKFVPVTLVKVLDQEVLRYKNEEQDGYRAMVVGVEKKDLKKEKGKKIGYTTVTEFEIDDNFEQAHQAGSVLDASVLGNTETLDIVGVSKGKGFQGVMKRFNTKGGPETHGSKFHRQVGSMGNRKPRRTMKGHPHAGRMGGERITLKDKKIIDVVKANGEELLIIKGSLPGAYNGLLKIIIK